MNPGAFEILEKYNLKGPKLYSLEELKNKPDLNRFYLRYSKKSNKDNKVVSLDYVLKNFKEIESEIKNGILSYIESTYNSIGGGVSLIKKDFSYTEYVKGHVISLLRRGLCGARILIDKGKVIKIVRCFQGWEAVQKDNYIYQPSMGPTASKINFIAQKMSSLLPNHHEGLLVEWLETPEEIIFCDARETGFEEFGNELYKIGSSEPNILALSNISNEKITNFIFDGLDVDNRKIIEDNTKITVNNGALLSHFVARNINKKIQVVLTTI